MKLENGFRRKLRYGSISAGITAAILATVVLLNVAVTALFSGNLWFIDFTYGELYTLSKPAYKVLGQTIDSANADRPTEDPVSVDIIFCADPDMLRANERMRYVYYTALAMQKAYPETVKVSTTNVWTNPSSVDAYRVNSYSSIYQNNIIVSSGTEFRVLSLKSFYYEAETVEENDLFDGENVFVRTILAVTRAESPICCLTVNHGEAFATEEGRAKYSEFVRVLENAGYEVQYINLETDEIPADCRLIVTMDPQTDFIAGYQTGGFSEIAKLDAFMKASKSFLVFTDADTPELYNLEEYLEEWGIAYERYEMVGEDGKKYNAGNKQVLDAEHSIDGRGEIFFAQYPVGGVGDSALSDVQTAGGEPKVLFGNATKIATSSTYARQYVPVSDEVKEAYTFYMTSKNGIECSLYDVFNAGERAVCQAKNEGGWILDGEQNPILTDTVGSYRLMSLSRQSSVSGGDMTSYVCAVGSTEFASNSVLSSGSYGNTDVLLSILREIGKEIETVGLDYKPLEDYAIGSDYFVAKDMTNWTVALVLIPAVLCTVVGAVVLIKRKARG